MQTSSARLLVSGIAGLAVIALACGFAFITNDTTKLPLKWPPGTIPMRILADDITVLSDGTTQATTIKAAMQDPTRGWNHYLGDAQFAPTILAAGSGADGNSINEIFFASTPYGMSFETNTLAVTTAWYISNRRVEADIVFNSAKSWDSYRGALRAATDIQRVASHELGHVLGLDHPDDAGQTVSAIMNSHVSGIDTPTADDITGVQSLYGPPGLQVNDNFSAATTVTLSGTTATVTGFNTNATKESGEPNHAGNIGGRSVWWKWTAPSAGTLAVTTQGSLCDTTLGIYAGSAVSALTMIASSDDVQAGVIQYSSTSFTAAGGTTYFFAVDGFNASDGRGADSAAVTLNLSFTSTGPPTTTSTSTSSTVPPTSTGGGGGGGGGAPSVWFFGALSLLAWARRMIPKKG